MSSQITYRDIDTEFNPIKPVTDAIRGAYCAGYSAFPAFYNGSPGGSAAQYAINQAQNDAICQNAPTPLPLPPAPIADGGQCPGVLYNLSGSVTFKINGGQSQTSPFDGGSVGGAIQIGGVQEDGIGWFITITSNITPANPQGITGKGYLLSKPPNPNVFYEFEGYNVQLTRLDGQADNCGNMKPDYRDIRPPNGNQVTTNVDININPQLTVNVPVIIAPRLTVIAPVLVVNVGGVEAYFDAGGVNINFPGSNVFPGGGGGNVDLKPVLDQTTQLLRDVDDVTDIVNDIYNARLFFEDDTVAVAGCSDDGVVERFIPVKVLRDENGNSQRDLFDTLFAEIFLLRTQGLIDCEESFDPVEISPPTTVGFNDVLYTAVQEPPTIGYLVEITNFEAKELRTYKLAGDEDLEAGFGNVVLVNSDYSTRGDLVFMRTRRLYIDARDVDVPHRVRVSLKPGITFRIVNLGYRKR